MRLAAAVWLAAAVAACGDGSSAPAPAPAPSHPAAAIRVSGGGTGFTTPREMFDYVNGTRQRYTSHIPFDGYPWRGKYVERMTWTVTFAWDEDLSAAAQREAEALASGAAGPKGVRFDYQNDPDGEPLWAAGLETDRYQVSARSDARLRGPPSRPDGASRWHDVGNGVYRQAVAYQTGTGASSRKTRLGVGAADATDGATWWVLIFGE